MSASTVSSCAGLADSPAQGMLPVMPSDEELMLKYQAGDDVAFDTLYQKYRGDVYRFLLRQLDRETAEELYQDIWIKLIGARDSYRVEARFRTWLYTIAHNRLRDYWRANRVDQDAGIDEESASSGPQHDPETRARDGQAVEVLLDGIQRLPAEQQQAFLLKVESGLSVEEIAGVMQASAESTKSRLRYATKKLREHLRGIWP